jgi:hypothetical protein
MLTSFQDVIVIFTCLLLAMLFLWGLQRFWPGSQRRIHNDITGWQITVIGTTYAVIVGFMLYAVWTTFQAAEINADNEANCLVNVFRLADGLPEAPRHQVHQLALEYVNVVLDEEWPAMERGEFTLAGHPVIEKLWAAMVQIKPVTFAEQTSMILTATEISKMTEYRRVRRLGNESKLPGILWLLMILGGIITTLSSCLFGSENFKLHALQVFSLTLLLSLALVAIADIDRPFQGAVHVLPRGFERARETLSQLPMDPQ